jgi:hypothetical protein
MPFSIADVVNDLDFAVAFTIMRSQNGKFVLGRWVNQTIQLNMWGPIQEPSPEELEMIPEGDRVSGVIAVWTTVPIYKTNVNLTNGISDIVQWHGENWRVLRDSDWMEYGYWKAYAVRMSGQ